MNISAGIFPGFILAMSFGRGFEAETKFHFSQANECTSSSACCHVRLVTKLAVFVTCLYVPGNWSAGILVVAPHLWSLLLRIRVKPGGQILPKISSGDLYSFFLPNTDFLCFTSGPTSAFSCVGVSGSSGWTMPVSAGAGPAELEDGKGTSCWLSGGASGSGIGVGGCASGAWVVSDGGGN